MRISDWSSDVCSSDLSGTRGEDFDMSTARLAAVKPDVAREIPMQPASQDIWEKKYHLTSKSGEAIDVTIDDTYKRIAKALAEAEPTARSEEHTSELQSLMRISYAVFCLKKKTKQ